MEIKSSVKRYLPIQEEITSILVSFKLISNGAVKADKA